MIYSRFAGVSNSRRHFDQN